MPDAISETTRPRPLDIAITLAFIALMLVQTWHHAMWRDELNAWGLVLASPTLPDLFRNMHYEGHPALWHLLLWLAAHVSTAPATIQVVHAIVAALIIGMVGLASPFNRIERVFLLAGYFLSLEYTVIARNYALCVLLALVYARARTARPDRLLLNALLLGLLANTTAYGTILSGVLALDLLIDRLAAPPASGRMRAWLALAALLYLACVALAAATMLPATDISWRTTGHPWADARSLGHLLKVAMTFIIAPLLPFQTGLLPAEPSDLNHMPFTDLKLPLLVMAGLVAMVGVILWREKRLLGVMALTVTGGVLFAHLFYWGSIRHWGITFIALLVCLWMQRMRRPTRGVLALVLLGFGALGGVEAGARQWQLPFSNTEATASWLVAEHLQDAALMGTPDTEASAVGIVLGKPVYQLDCACLRFDNRRDPFTLAQIPDRIAAAAAHFAGRDRILLMGGPLTAAQIKAIRQRGLSVTLLTELRGSLIDEDFVVYRVAETS